MAVAQFSAGQHESALTTARKLVTLAPNTPMYHFRLANILIAMGKTDASRASLQRSLALKPDLYAALIALTALEIQTGRYPEAQQLATKIQQLAPQIPTGFVLEGDSWAAQNKHDKAAESYQAAWERGRSQTLAVKLHRALVLAGNPGDADALLDQWLDEKPNDDQIRGYFAESLMNRQQNKAAVDQYQILLDHAPDSVVAMNNLAWAMNLDGNPKALAHAEKAHKLEPANAAIMDTLGWILLRQGQYKRAIDLFRRALEKAPDAASFQYHLAAALAESGDRVTAKAELKRLVDSGVSFSEEEEAKRLLEQL